MSRHFLRSDSAQSLTLLSASPAPSLSRLLKSGRFPELADSEAAPLIEDLQAKILRIQQGIFHKKARAIIALEGFDASGKGGLIRRITEHLDPRSVIVHPIGAPDPIEHGKHHLYRFWTRLPEPGNIAIFDRTWYGRVLVERVDELIPPRDWKRAYSEINAFEEMLVNDGIELIKIFLAIDKGEQYRRFEERLRNPSKQWKFTEADIRARRKWKNYVAATDDLFRETHTRKAPWNLIAANDKDYTRVQGLKLIVRRLGSYGKWMEKQRAPAEKRSLRKLLKALK